MPKDKASWKRRIKFWFYIHFGSRLAAGLLKLLGLTLRKTTVNEQYAEELMAEHGRLIYVFWHGDTIAASIQYYFKERKRRKAVVLVSPSRDGEVLARAIGHLGSGAVRGSSASHGVAGMKAMVEAVKREGNATLAADGPRGPRHEIKPGVLLLAKLSQTPILPVTMRYGAAWTLKSWDRMRIPKPFSALEVTYHPPLLVAAEAIKNEIENTKNALHSALMSGSETREGA